MASESLASRLKRIRKSKGLTKYRLAKLSGVSDTYIYRIELEQIPNPRRDTLQKLAHGLGISLSELIGEAAPIDTWQLVEQSLKAYIPVYAEVRAGTGMEPVDYVACTRAKAAPENLRAYRVRGLCLAPEINDGDTIIVDTALAPCNGDLIIVFMDGKAAVKRYKEDSHGNKWIEDNHGRYEPEEAIIHGVVIEYMRKLR